MGNKWWLLLVLLAGILILGGKYLNDRKLLLERVPPAGQVAATPEAIAPSPAPSQSRAAQSAAPIVSTTPTYVAPSETRADCMNLKNYVCVHEVAGNRNSDSEATHRVCVKAQKNRPGGCLDVSTVDVSQDSEDEKVKPYNCMIAVGAARPIEGEGDRLDGALGSAIQGCLKSL